MAEKLIDDGYATVLLIRGWLPSTQTAPLLQELQAKQDWISGTMEMWGKTVAIPRRLLFYGDEGISTYSYSRMAFSVQPWVDSIRNIRDRITTETGLHFNSCLLNEYRDGDDYIAYHSDKETGGERRAVVTVSLGGTRHFYLKSKTADANGKFPVIKTDLHDGDCLVMLDACQERYTHSVPRQKGVGYRISLTFRLIST
jgi:alkylated DNA repair dioxygenase AlkB